MGGTRGRGEAGEPGPDAEERLRVGLGVDHLLGVLESLRRIYIVFAILLGGLFLLVASTGYAFRSGALAAAATVLLGLSASLGAVAGWDLYRHPRLWSILLAALATIDLGLSGLALLAGPSVPGAIRVLLLGLGTAGLWYGAHQILRLGDLLRSHPDLVAARRNRAGVRRSPEGKASRRAREKGKVEGAMKRRHALVYAGGTVGVALLVGMLLYNRLHPPLEPVVDSFRTSWNSADWAGIGKRFEPGTGDRMGKSLDILLGRRGWKDAPPALEAGTITEGVQGRAVALFPGAGGEVRTEWRLVDGAWLLTGIRLPER